METRLLRGSVRYNFAKLALLLMPTFVRDPFMTAFLKALMNPAQSIYSQLLAFNSECQNRMSYNSQVCFLRKMLNDKFDSASRRITIADAAPRRHVMIYRTAEQKPKMLGTIMISRLNEISASSEFVVNIPVALKTRETEIRAWVNFYRLVTHGFSIKYI